MPVGVCQSAGGEDLSILHILGEVGDDENVLDLPGVHQGESRTLW